jgi:hypothetical protein
MSSTLALLRRHVGIWEGVYTHLAASDWRTVGTQRFRIRVEVFATGPVVYRQTSHYWHDDGREDELVYEGSLRRAGGPDTEDRVVFDDGRIRGECWAIEPLTLYLWFAYLDRPGARIAEMIQLSPDGAHRARTWHWFRDDALQQLTLVRERRTSADPGDWPAAHASPPD